jgi:hypothetical protein
MRGFSPGGFSPEVLPPPAIAASCLLPQLQRSEETSAEAQLTQRGARQEPAVDRPDVLPAGTAVRPRGPAAWPLCMALQPRFCTRFARIFGRSVSERDNAAEP